MPKKNSPVTRRDSLDFRDRIYQPALVPLKAQLLPQKSFMNVRDQGYEGACSGFGLAAVIDYLNRSKGIKEPVSTRMLYEMAKRHDRWPGEDYEGSSARGAMKGWHKNGVCPEKDWPYDPDDPGFLTRRRQVAALEYPLGAYYRILPKRSDAHAALNEVEVIFATADTHRGWDNVDNGLIPYKPAYGSQGGHAFAILGYTEEGFIVQNSWGDDWGGLQMNGTFYPGCAIWRYDDFEDNVWDLWVARLALPVTEAKTLRVGAYIDVGGRSEAKVIALPQHEIRDHYVHIDDGEFDRYGDYPSHEDQVREIIQRAVRGDGKPPKHIVFYAHGGLNSVKGSAARAVAWRNAFIRNNIHELHFIWETGMWEELRDVLLGKEESAKKRAGGLSDWWDRMIERATHSLGHALWKEMQSDAANAFQDKEKAGSKTLAMFVDELDQLSPGRRPKLHLVGHSAGSIWIAHLLERWRSMQEIKPKFDNVILFAPACTTDLYNEHIFPAIKDGTVGKLHHFFLDAETEKNDSVANVYRKSLLYLVSRSYQKRGDIVPIMGMQIYVNRGLLREDDIKTRIRHYNTKDNRDWTTSSSHGGFDNDPTTMNSMLKLVLEHKPKEFKMEELEGY